MNKLEKAQKKSNLITEEFLLMCQKVADQTDSNNHIGAKLTVAKFFDLKHFVKAFECVEILHTLDGSLLPDVGSIRTRNSKAMLEYLKAELTAEQFKKLNNSF